MKKCMNNKDNMKPFKSFFLSKKCSRIFSLNMPKNDKFCENTPSKKFVNRQEIPYTT